MTRVVTFRAKDRVVPFRTKGRGRSRKVIPMHRKSSSRGLEYYVGSVGSAISKYQEERKKRREETEKKNKDREAELARARAQESLDTISKKLSEIKAKLAGLNERDEPEEPSDEQRIFLEGEIDALEKERMRLVDVVHRFERERAEDERSRSPRRRMTADERFDRYVAGRVKRIDEFQEENK